MKTRLLAVPTLAVTLIAAGCSSGDSPAVSYTSETERIEAFCDVVAEMTALDESGEFEDLNAQMALAVANATSDTDPEAIAAVQAWGDALYRYEQQVIPLYEDLLAITDDPQLQRGLRLTIDINTDLGLTYAKRFSEITSVSDMQDNSNELTEATLALLEDQEDYAALVALDTYVVDQCGMTLGAG
jgi:hypothetical protein